MIAIADDSLHAIRDGALVFERVVSTAPLIIARFEALHARFVRAIPRFAGAQRILDV